MAHHLSALKRIRQEQKRKQHNRYYARTTRNAVKTLRKTTDKQEAVELYPKVEAMLDKLAKTHVIHKNKAANLKSKLAKHINSL
ncbi:MAG: 30S ribosomal protein S20 [Bacteroidales bacterium]|nr:30S ribosomal protein S20 [Bacteroidales bacterium]